MNKDKPVEKVDDWIIQYHQGTLDSDGMEKLLLWVEENSENKRYFKEKLNLLRSIQAPDIHFDAEKGLKEFHRNIRKKRPYSYMIKWAAVAAVAALIVIVGKNLLDHKASVSPEFIENIAIGENMVKVLEDETRVTLSENSILFFPEIFSEEQRNVKLEGKAFFEVAEDSDRPFTVQCENVFVHVLGTSFEIETDASENTVCVTVISGKVRVEHPESGLVKNLGKDEAVIISQDGHLVKESSVYDENLLSWKTGVLIFNNVEMSEVAEVISEFYGIHFTFEDEQLEEEFVTLTINNQTVEEVIKILELILDASIFDDEGDMIIRKNQ